MPNRDRSLKKYREGYARIVFDRLSAPTSDSSQQKMRSLAIRFRQKLLAINHHRANNHNRAARTMIALAQDLAAYRCSVRSL
jgi:hypothetical protein